MNESSIKLAIVFGDEFRQILIASQQNVVKATIKSSYLCSYKVFGKHEIFYIESTEDASKLKDFSNGNYSRCDY